MAYMSTNTGGGTPTKAEDADANTKIQVEESADENKIRFDTAGSERMIIDETGKVGIGTSSPASDLHIVAAGSGDNVIIETTVANSTTSAPNVVLYRNGATAEDSDLIGQIVFRGKNDAGSPQDVDFATIETGMDDVSDGSEDGNMTFNLIEAGTLTEFMRLRGSTRDVVVNDQADDIDFRVESSSNQNMLFVDASTDAVGIGTATPAAKLHVDGDARFRASVEVCTSDPAPANSETGTIYQFTKGSAGVFTLPASPPVGTQFVLVNGDGQDIVITRPHSSVKINGATSNATNTTAYAATSIVAVVSNGNNSEWLAFGGI